MNIYFFNPPIGTEVVNLDYNYMLFRTTCPEYHWPFPIIDWSDYKDIDDIVQEILSHDPHAVLMSIYIWNETLCSDVARRLKEKRPDLPILVGGPQIRYTPDYFEEHPGFDLICTQYGEHFLPEALSQIKQHGTIVEPLTIPWALSREGLSPVTQKFEWGEDNIALDNLDYVVEVTHYAARSDKTVSFNYETTRGCPFQCSYCEWGGGTNTKVIAKPFERIEAELSLLLPMGIDNLGISDANFGILKRDADIIDLAAAMRESCGYPETFMCFGYTKTKMKQRERVLDRLLYHGFDDHFYMAFQSVNPQALVINRRTDIGQADYFALYNRFRDKYGISARLECIMGLPGSTLQDFYHEMDLVQYLGGWHYGINVFYLLPNVEAFGQTYRGRYQVVTFPGQLPYSEEFRASEESFHDTTILSRYRSACEVVCESYSYTRWEWMEMHVMGTTQSLYGDYLTRLSSSVAPRLWHWFKDQSWFSVIESHYERLFDGLHKGDFLILSNGEYLFDFIRTHVPHMAEVIRQLENDDDPLPHTQESVDHFLRSSADNTIIKVAS